jgi:plastocyanin
MRWALAVFTLLVIAGVPAAMAAKKDMKDPPGKAAIAKAGDKVIFVKERSVTHTYANGKTATFVPCDIGTNREEIEHGMILGKLELTKATKELEPGVYRVYIRKHGNHWQAFFCQDDKPVAQADECEGGLEGESKPRFMDAGTRIRYGWFKFSF